MAEESEKHSSDNSREERVRFAKIVLRIEKKPSIFARFYFRIPLSGP